MLVKKIEIEILNKDCWEQYFDRLFGQANPDWVVENRDQYRHFLSKLDERQNTFWCHYRCGDLVYEEIAEEENCAVGTVFNVIGTCKETAGRVLRDGQDGY